MGERQALIERKASVQRSLTQVRRQIEVARGRGRQHDVERLSAKAEGLMAEEYRLRIAIDRAA